MGWHDRRGLQQTLVPFSPARDPASILRRFAQKLLYQNTTDGDISHLISGYFDPASCGRKTEKQSYEEIALSLGFSECPGDVAFFTDLKDEVTAATDAGLLCVHMDRPGNAIVPDGALPSSVKTITSFEQFVI
eukprot:scaffold979_cov382-Prasinococcus_capsulatus_cf.AAC.8